VNARPEASASVRITLKRLGLRIKSVEPDGNCQFRAVADQIYGDPDRYRQVRNMAIAELERGEELYSGFVTDDEPFAVYLARMRDESEWGDQLTLMALAAAASLRVIVHQNDAERPRYELVPPSAVKKTIHVLFHDNPSAEHYDSVRALGDGEEGEPPKEIPWDGNHVGGGSEGGDVDELADELRDGASVSGGKKGGKGKSRLSKKQMQAEVLEQAVVERRREELAKTLRA